MSCKNKCHIKLHNSSLHLDSGSYWLITNMVIASLNTMALLSLHTSSLNQNIISWCILSRDLHGVPVKVCEAKRCEGQPRRTRRCASRSVQFWPKLLRFDSIWAPDTWTCLLGKSNVSIVAARIEPGAQCLCGQILAPPLLPYNLGQATFNHSELQVLIWTMEDNNSTYSKGRKGDCISPALWKITEIHQPICRNPTRRNPLHEGYLSRFPIFTNHTVVWKKQEVRMGWFIECCASLAGTLLLMSEWSGDLEEGRWREIWRKEGDVIKHQMRGKSGSKHFSTQAL